MNKKVKVLKIGSIFICLISLSIIFLIFRENNGTILSIRANIDKGFNYGYYLYIPAKVDSSAKKYLLVEPNNTGSVSDNIKFHAKSAKQLVTSRKSLADKLGCILLVPTFIRPESNDLMYTHALDRDTILNYTGDLARIDLQLINMINDAKTQLQGKGHLIEEKVLLNGFSASGSFVNRFTALHPYLVQAVASGGVNCMPILPTNKLKGETLIYPVGIADVKEITGVAFDFESYALVPQFIYMGNLDDNDTLPYSDAFSDEEREIIIQTLGLDMHGRWEKSKQIYEELGCSATFDMYDGIGHEMNLPIEKDIVEFFKDNIK